MTKEDLEAVFDRIRALSAEKQEELEEVIEWLETDDKDFYQIPEEARPAIERGLADAKAGRFVSDEEMAEFFAKARRILGK